MSLADCADRSEVVKKYRIHESDSGSSEVQIALLTKRLEQISGHFQTHLKDEHSRRGMMRMISRRKRLLQYLKNEDVNRYKAVLSSLGLRK